MSCAGELQKLMDGVEQGRGGCLVLEGAPAPELPVLDVRARVVHHRASTDDQVLTYAGLSALCDPFLPVLSELPSQQAEALGGALGLGPPPTDGLAVALAFRSLLHRVADSGPVILVVERAHLLDRASAAALGFAARGLDATPIGLVVSQDPTALGRLELVGARHCRTDIPADQEASPGPGPSSSPRASDPTRPALDPDSRPSNLVATGRAWLGRGHVDRAQRFAEAARRASGTASDVARAELLLGRVHTVSGDGRVASVHLRAAVDAAGRDLPDVAAEAALLLAIPPALGGRADRAEVALEEADRRLDEAAIPAGHPLRALRRTTAAALDLAVGRTVEPVALTTLARRVIEDTDPANLPLVTTAAALPLVWVEHYGEASALLHQLIASLRSRGAHGALPVALCALSVAERRAGRPTRALIAAGEARHLAEQLGHRAAWCFAQSELANAHGIMGELDRCRVAAHAVLQGDPSGRSAYRTSALSAMATAELWVGDPAAAIELLEPLAEAEGGAAQAVTLYLPTLAAAYVATGRTDDARQCLLVLERSSRAVSGRVAVNVSRCRALLSSPPERDAAFAAAIDQATGHPVAQGLTRILHARRLLADGEIVAGATLLRDLAAIEDEDLLGVARAARLTLARLGMVVSSGDTGWARLERGELEAALAGVDGTPLLGLAERLRLSAEELEVLRGRVAAVVGMPGPTGSDGDEAGTGPGPRREIRVLGGLAVVIDGRPMALPAGAASTAVAVLALRRAVHVEELTDVLWPEAGLEVARRRLRNVLTRVRRAVGPLLVRRGDRIVLAEGVAVDHHELETAARRALARPGGPERARELAELLCRHSGVLLPEATYDEWSQLERQRAEARREELTRALAAERAEG